MFLNLLNKEEKASFLNLASAIIVADNVVRESEKEFMQAYALEMNLVGFKISDNVDVDQILKQFADNSTPAVQRIVLAELIALAVVDGNYAPEEQNLINKVASAFNLEKEFIEKVMHLEDMYTNAFMSLKDLIEKGE